MSKAQKKNKQYVLGMFPYPSGEGLHVGHVRIYTAVDVMARYLRHQGNQVLVPMGWDAFGLPAENAAIKNKANPQDIVPKNYGNFKKQMQKLNFDFDWEHELSTTDPTYYGFTQWLFLKLYEAGLVYRDKVAINWCPKCKTGLANEEVLGDGTHERCGSAVEKKLLPQWVMKITDYAEELLKDLDKDLSIEDPRIDSDRSALDWPRGILEMQRNWIGRDKGLKIKFELDNGHSVFVWTKYWETLYGTTFVVVAPELAKKWIGLGWKPTSKVADYIERSLMRTDLSRQEGVKEKSGIDTGLKAINPANDEAVPLYVADYVLGSVGTGAVMGVPAHDERDFDFAKKYGLPIKQVVEYEDKQLNEKVKRGERSFEGEGKLVNSGEFDGMEAWGEGKERMAKWLVEQKLAVWEINYHLRDWIFSRQRYWGEPIPLVYCDNCGDDHGVVALTERDLPLELPYLESYEPTDTGESPLSRVEEWVKTICPKCGGPAKRETDTMPNWAGSCWYFLAFPWWVSDNQKTQNFGKSDMSENRMGSHMQNNISKTDQIERDDRKSIDSLLALSKSTKSILDTYKAKSEKPYSEFWAKEALPTIKEWLPVDWYLGGAEHAVLHLLYARFWVKVFQKQGLLDFPEPFLRLRSVGMVLAEDGRKMSKSLGNVINPDDMVAQYGADAVRLYEMFMGPWDQAISWDTRALVGLKRFLERTLDTMNDLSKVGDTTTPQLLDKMAKVAKQIEKGVTEQKFNTAIAGLMELLNEWRQEGNIISVKELSKLAIMYEPFAPITALQIWEKSNSGGDLKTAAWPIFDQVVLDLPVTIAVQINGKLRGTMVVSKEESMDQDSLVSKARDNEQLNKWIENEPKKIIFVPGKLLNFVLSQ